MERLHPVLHRQLARLGLASAAGVPTEAQWHELLQRVSRVYHEADAERSLLERSQDLASQEMTELYRALEAKRNDLERRVAERTRRLQESQTHLAESAAHRDRRQLELRARHRAGTSGRRRCYRLLRHRRRAWYPDLRRRARRSSIPTTASARAR